MYSTEKTMQNTEKLNIVVLSRNYSTGLGIIRSLGEAGYNVDLIASTKKKGSSIIASCSKYVRNAWEVLTPKIQGDDGIKLIAALKQYAEEHPGKKVLFPVDDFTTSVVDKNRDVLSDSFLMPNVINGGNGSITEIMDKCVQSRIAQDAGLLTPAEWKISLKNEIDIPDDIIYPCFVKPIQSFSGHKTEMAVCASVQELRNHLLKMQSFYREREVLVQEYLHIDQEIDLSGVCIDQQIIIPAIVEKTRIAQHEQGVTMSGKMAPLELLGEVEKQIKEMLRQFHYVGMFDMELNVCDGRIYFNEVNFRSGGPNFAYHLNGVNLPDIFVKEITGTGHDPKEEKLNSFGKSFVYEKVAWEDYMHSYISKAELKACISEADFTLLENANDPEPGKCFYKRIRLSALKNKLKNLVRKTKVRPAGKQSRKERVMVAGRNYGNILAMTRGLGEAGYDVDVFRIDKKKPHRLNLLGGMAPESHSKYIRKFTTCIVNDEPINVINRLIELAGENEKTVLIPVDDYTVSLFDEHLEALESYYTIPSMNDCQGEISHFMDKYLQKTAALQFDLPLLRSWLIKSVNGSYTIPEDIGYPCFIKPNISMKSTKDKMMKCSNAGELDNVLQRYALSEDFEILVEEFADIKNEYSILGISTPEKTIAPCMFRVTAGGHRERKGVAITGETVSCEPFRKIIDESIEFIESLNYTGLFDVDLIETTDGSVYFIELNFRAGASIHAFTEAGINLPGMLANYFTGKTVDWEEKDSIPGKTFVSEKVLLEEFARSDVSLSQLRRKLSEADIHFIKNCKDPKPYKKFRKYYFVAALMRIPYRLRDLKRKGN